MLHRAGNLRNDVQQRVRRRHERVQPAGDLNDVHLRGLIRRCRARGRGAPTRRRHDDRAIETKSLEWIVGHRLPPHGPELQLEAGNLTRDEHRECSGLLGLLPEIAVTIELEIEEPSVIGNLPGRHRQTAKHDPR